MNTTATDIERAVFRRFCRVADQAHDLERALSSLLSVLQDVLSVTKAAFFVVPEYTDKMVPAATIGLDDPDDRARMFNAARLVRDKAPAAGFAVLAGEYALVPRSPGSVAPERTETSWIGAPLQRGSQRLGWFLADSLDRPETTLLSDITFAEEVADTAARFVLLSRESKEQERRLKQEIEVARRECSRGGIHAKTHSLQMGESVVSLKDMERRELLSALERHDWIQSRAARDLGLSLRQMGYRIKKFHLEERIKEGRARKRN